MRRFLTLVNGTRDALVRAMNKYVFAAPLFGLVFLAACSSSSDGDQASSPTGAQNPTNPAGSDPNAAANAGGGGKGSSDEGSKDPKAEPKDPEPTPITYKNVALHFDELTAGARVVDQYAQYLTFSSDEGCGLDASTSAGLAASPPNYLMSYYSCANGPSASIFIDFAKPVRNPRVTFVGVNSGTKVADVKIVRGAALAPDAREVVGLGSYSKPVLFDATGVAGVTRIEITNVNDAYGLGIDDLSFDVPQ